MEKVDRRGLQMLMCVCSVAVASALVWLHFRAGISSCPHRFIVHCCRFGCWPSLRPTALGWPAALGLSLFVCKPGCTGTTLPEKVGRLRTALVPTALGGPPAPDLIVPVKWPIATA